MKKKAFNFLLTGLFSIFMLFPSCKDNTDTPDASSGTFTDTRDGKTYNWKKIGDQVWMTENLAFLTSNCWAYDNDENKVGQYGYLYTWDAALVAAPSGWHVATDSEWKELQKYLGLSQMEADEEGWQGKEGDKLKSTTGWNENGGGTDEVGFRAMPGGYYLGSGAFGLIGNSGIWWTATEATEFNTSYAWLRQMSANNDAIYRGKNDKNYGYSVRCVQD